MKKTQSHKTSLKSSKAKSVENTKLSIVGWKTSDADEIELRRTRAKIEKLQIENLEPQYHPFSTFSVYSRSGATYRVEIRSLMDFTNSCDCPDYHTNELGTCKHIEHVLFRMRKKNKKQSKQAKLTGSSRIEIFLDRRNNTVQINWPNNLSSSSSARQLLEPFFSNDGSLLASPTVAYSAIQHSVSTAQQSIKNQIRISCHMNSFIEAQERLSQKKSAKETFLADIQHGKQSANWVNFPLYPYQVEGMLHLAFTERALLADEMGLGKTVQAIAACALLHRLRGIQKVLVIATASLKAEWEEQIAKFTSLSSLIIQGPRAERLKQYQRPAFFYLANYEQILMDGPEMQRLIAPDVIILDEAQRIKNWHTKTASAVKQLISHYAFVLTGTPLENRIDDIYSIVQFLDPQIFGSLFRFNRQFYQLDGKGKPSGYKNLDELHRRLRTVMLRRRKSDVEGELPERTVNNYFVSMDIEQQNRYDEYKDRVARLLSTAQRRPLTKEEHEKLQKWLSCMRMLCDTPYILDSECRISPKLRELESILEELLQDNTTKIIIFSEWERMLQLIHELTEKMKIEAVWHTGSVPQHKRRAAINRFKEKPECRLFLSTDSGSVGLNLQCANVVINIDLPWNPAKLEQRIARAWRKHQTRTVQVINLVSEESIEHRMLDLLAQKQALAQTVLEENNLTEMKLPSGRAAFMERMANLMGTSLDRITPPTSENQPKNTSASIAVDPIQILHNDLLARFRDRVDLIEVHQNNETQQNTIIAVVDNSVNQTLEQLQPTLTATPLNDSTLLEVLDRNTYQIIQRLAQAGYLTIHPQGKTLHTSQTLVKSRKALLEKQITQARKHLDHAERKQRMASVLIESDFTAEAIAPLREATESMLHSFAWLTQAGVFSAEEVSSQTFIKEKLVEQHGLPEKILPLLNHLHPNHSTNDHKNISILLNDSREIHQHVEEALTKAMLG